MEAIPYLQQALRANATIEALHNTLGLCLKDVGRPEDAAWHFEKALALRPSYVEARFNLGTLWQATKVYDRAIDEFRTLAAMVQAHSLDLTVAHQRDVFVRLCGAYQGAARRDDALGCLNDALALWPHDTDFINERGNWYLNAGYLDLAHDDYQVAADAGALVATLLQLTETRHLSTSHIRMVQAGVVPRVLPFDSALVDQARQDMGRRLDAMLQQGMTDYHPHFMAFLDSITTVDWTDLMTNQFPTGYHLISHPHNNNQLKQKLATMLEMYAPSLKTPSFLDRSYSTIPRELRHRSRIGFVAEDSHVLDLVHALDQSKFDVFLFTAVAAGVPTVTLPGQLWRTRVPFGVLRHINTVATVATSAADYVRLAVRAAGDQPFRDAVVATLHSNGPKLFGDDTAVIEWTRFLHFALDQARRVRQETPVM
ncbi:hypothetical protein DYB28_005125 [Aphanomyces astaci]|uniref:O-GlcNAc transferase C-terminal domain-containing protein n=1 Tax=Aphanomyces astaci TaxID=112090 RepID=A0A9X8DXH7_APHAT|nr:hypothetical protein DYB28_005125 [Aphanomyces astaci]